MHIYVLAKLTKRSGKTLEVEHYPSGFSYVLKENELSHTIRKGEIYFLKLLRGKTESGGTLHTLIEFVEIKKITGEAVSDISVLSKCETLFTSLGILEEGIRKNRWYSFHELQAQKELKELQAEGIDLRAEEKKLKELLSQKESVTVKEQINQIDEWLIQLDETTQRHKWDEALYNGCKTCLSLLKEKGVLVEERERKLTDLKENIMKNPVYLRRECDRLNQLMQTYIENLEDKALDGGWSSYAWKEIEKLKEELKTFGLYEQYEDKIMELENIYQEIKAKTFIPVFTTKQADEIRGVKDYPLRAILASKNKEAEQRIKEYLLLAKKDREENFPQLCLEFVKREPFAIAFLEKPTLESCLLAITSNISILQHIEEQTPELTIGALELNPEAVKYLKL